MRSLIALLFVVAFTSVSTAGNCHVFYRHHAVVQQVVAVPYVGYAVGANIQEDAIASRIADKAFARIQALTQAQTQTQQLAKPDTSILTAKCARCHGGAVPAGELLIDGTSDFPADSLKSWMRMAGLGEGIPDKMKPVIAGLKPEEIASITEALLRSGQ